MQGIITPILLLAASIGLFLGYIDPQYKEIKIQKAELAQYNDALEKSAELRKVRDELIQKDNGISRNNREKIKKMLPETVDNVRLILDMDSIASKFGLSIKNIKVGETTPDSSDTFGPSGKKYGSIELSFSVTASYKNFLAFLQDLEQSLRIVDVVSLTVRSSKADLYEYDVVLKTYWLK